MLDRQRLARNSHGLALLFACVFLALSLAGYDPADSPGSAASPANDPPRNYCGPVGALLAHVLFTAFGWSSWLILLAMGVLDALAFRRRSVPEKRLRLAGFVLVVSVAATLIQARMPTVLSSPPVGPGGYVGAIARAFLFGQFGPVGMVLILLAAGFIGLALCHDVLIVWPAQEVLAAIRGARAQTSDSYGSTQPALGLHVDSYTVPSVVRLEAPPRVPR